MFSEAGVRQIERSELEVVGALNDGVICGVKVDLRVVEVSASELRARYGDPAVFAISEKDRAFDRPDIERSVGASVDGDLRTEVRGGTTMRQNGGKGNLPGWCGRTAAPRSC